MEFNKKELAQKVSLLYYENNKSQNEIATELEISRSYVSQLLSFARKSGIVEIIVHVDEFGLRMIREEVRFKTRFPGLKQVYIMKSQSEGFTELNLGKFSVPYIADMINDAEVIGVNLGQAVENTIDQLQRQSFADTSNKQVVQIMGGFSNSAIRAVQPNEVVRKLGTILNCDSYYLNCPAVVEQPQLRKALLREKSIETIANMWNHIDLAIMGIGVADGRSKLFNTLTPEMSEVVERSNAYAELTINFFDKEGKHIHLLEDNKISIPFRQLKKIKRKVVICYGEYKKKAIAAALKAGMIDVLITDSITINAVENYIDGKHTTP
ncbi:MAG: hypothetical protein GX352_05565 [Clostridiales bacterium]|nr:hypothetical protein [Clostridiales bacterium]